MKVLWLTNIPSPYRVDFFNELGGRCELTVLFEKSNSSERNELWNNYQFNNFSGIILKGVNYSFDKALSIEVLRYLDNNKYDHVVVSNFTTLTGMIAIEYMRLKKIKYYLESDGGFVKDGKGAKEKLKKHIIKDAKGYFSTAKNHDEYYLYYGAMEEKILRYPFTSIKSEYFLKQPLTSSEKQKIKNKIGMTEDKIILSVGSFIPLKGYDILLNACKNIENNIGVYLIGGEPPQEFLKMKKELDLKHVHFISFKNSNELREYYRSADIFVHPTRSDVWGLVINEAMASGLPIITTDKCIAGLELVENEANGFIIPSDNAEELERAINYLINDDTKMKEMNRESLRRIQKYTIEEMVESHMEIFEKQMSDL